MPDARTGVSCNAPFVSMYLDQRGRVRACCMNEEHELGNITESRLSEVWHGTRLAALRAAVAAGDLTLGCGFCASQVALGNPEAVFARTFDHLRTDTAAPSWPRQLELSLSNACNLQCLMCNGEWSSSIRVHRDGMPALPRVYGEEFFDDLELFLPHLERINFLGGEPFIAPESLRVMDMVLNASADIACHVTTNGTQWSARIERLVRGLDLDVTLSIDAATPRTYESIRVGADWDLLQSNLERFIEIAAPAGNRVAVAFCLMDLNWHEFFDVCRQADDRSMGCVVNTVTSPAHLSVIHQPLDRLEAIVSGLEARDRRDGHLLTASRTTWRNELGRLRAHLEQRSGRMDRTTPVASAVELRRSRAGIPSLGSATELLGFVRELGAHRLAFDEAGVVSGVQPGTTAAGLDPESFLGCSLTDLEAVAAATIGEAAPAEALAVVADHQLWRTRFANGTSLVSLLVTTGSGPTLRTVELHLADEEQAGSPEPVDGGPRRG